MDKYGAARKKLRIVLALLVLSELPVAIFLLFFPHLFVRLYELAPRPEPFFIREVGNFLLFAAYLQYLGFRNPEKHLRAVQLTIVLRVLAGALELVEITLILKTVDLFFGSLLFFCVANFLFAYLIVRYLRQMELKWLEI